MAFTTHKDPSYFPKQDNFPLTHPYWMTESWPAFSPAWKSSLAPWRPPRASPVWWSSSHPWPLSPTTWSSFCRPFGLWTLCVWNGELTMWTNRQPERSLLGDLKCFSEWIPLNLWARHNPPEHKNRNHIIKQPESCRLAVVAQYYKRHNWIHKRIYCGGGQWFLNQ